MTKLSYINRKSEGVKLGQIVAKDLRKRIKQTTPPKGDIHKDGYVDLFLDGKSLTDEGLADMARGLEETLTACEDGHRTRLRLLHLHGNELTARSLSELAPSIRAAAEDLEELDLSGNQISVTTDDELCHWQIFLKSLGCTQVLASLNLSGSELSGTGAMEVFWKVYEQQFHLNDKVLETLADEMDDLTVNEFNLPEKLHAINLQQTPDSTEPGGSKSFTGAPTNKLKGLPSIPTINLSNVGLTDSGALFLSYSLAQHRWIHDQVLGTTVLKHTLPNQGIIHLPNKSLSANGEKVLKFAENAVYEPPAALPPVPENSPMSRTGSVDVSQGRRASALSQHFRKSSLNSPGESMGKSLLVHQHANADDLDSLRKKLQRTILEEKGPCSVELWKAALQLLSYARAIIPEEVRTPCPPSQAMSPVSMEASNERRASSSSRDIKDDKIVSPSSHISSPAPQSLFASRFFVTNEHATPSYPSETPHIFRHPRRRRGSFSFHSSSSSPGNRAAGEARAILKDAIRLTDCQQKLIGPFPATVWTLILAQLADRTSVLSKRQIQSIVNWARDKATLAFEMEALGKPDSVQIWRTLDGMECLEYDGRG